MNAMKIFKILGVVVFSGGLFTAGYFWGQDKAHQEMGSGQPSASSDMGSMKGMSDMPGMVGMNMTPGTAMVNPQMQ